MMNSKSKNNRGNYGSHKDSLEELLEFGKSCAASDVAWVKFEQRMLLAQRGGGGWDSYVLAEVMTPAHKSNLEHDLREDAVVRYVIISEFENVVTVVAVERGRAVAAVGEIECTSSGRRRLKAFEDVPARSVGRLTEMLPRLDA